MKRNIFYALALTLPACFAEVEHKDTTERTFALASGTDGKLIVDNVTGSVTVTGTDGQEVRVTVREHWRADSAADLDAGRREVKLEMTQEGNTVKLMVDGPWRDCNCGDGNRRGRSDRERNYRVRHDFEVRVPRNITADVRTVNSGSVVVRDVRSGVIARNVNGSVELTDVAGKVSAHTVNGTVRTSFTENPRESSNFKTINGEISVEFQPALAADLRFKTMNGDAFTDFEVMAAPLEPAAAERNGTKYVYRSNRASRVRVAGGGPEHSFETLNGNIKIAKRGK